MVICEFQSVQFHLCLCVHGDYYRHKKMSQNQKDIELKKTLIKAKRIIQKKFKDLHDQRSIFDQRVQEEYKPIIKPLNDLVNIKKEKGREVNIKQEKLKKEVKLEVKPEVKFKGKERYAFKKYDQTPFSKESAHVPKRLFTQSTGEDSDDTNRNSETEEIEKEEEKESSLESLYSTDSSEGAAAPSRSTKKAKIDRSTVNIMSSPLAPLSPSDISNNHYTVQSNLKTRELRLGKRKVTLGEKAIKVSTKNFPTTNGVINLLMQSQPTEYNENDLKIYKSILEHTNAHRSDFMSTGHIVRDETNPKYQTIIKFLFPHPRTRQQQHNREGKQGGSLKMGSLQTNYMIHSKQRSNLTYWDDPNELVERLKLLVASESAGHTGHNNEIISIIEELREANIIA